VSVKATPNKLCLPTSTVSALDLKVLFSGFSYIFYMFNLARLPAREVLVSTCVIPAV